MSAFANAVQMDGIATQRKVMRLVMLLAISIATRYLVLYLAEFVHFKDNSFEGRGI